MVARNNFVITFRGCEILRGKLTYVSENYDRLKKQISYLKFVAERLIIEKDPGIMVFSIPLVFELPHALHDPWKFRVTNQADQSRSRLGRNF